ncbi:LacI family transcriptional regulator [Sphingomonas sp. So64.6b]|uniref:LacI family DNA-binding transcriptional regulator n=1 Tax=Sphingomonas sp. So64.6b TaxID=2997354 RepID=UPI0016024F75|nr:LacI family DNA-binding transcriptional regulator [Sphingomonas sp. So64.6b]QNA84483.1 LacI family transcriptional regulator [Sphingomonas sp. So64.6b]
MVTNPRKPRAGSGRQSGAPTIADVAALAGVSTMTVSRVINAESNVRASTREAVNAAIGQLNYAPNRAARSLAGASQLRLGLLYSNPSAAYLSEFLVGSLDQAGRSDIQLIVEKCELGDHERRVVERMIGSGIDGVILPPPLCDSRSVLDVLIAARVPTVVVATGCPPPECAAISIDDRGAAQAMTRHLIELGHARIGFITGNPNLTASGERLVGYRAALTEAGMPFDEDLVADGLFTYRSGLDAADELLEGKNPPSAIFASNDDMAAATVAVAHRRGLDVPGDLTVCGFDDSALATTIWPELTTIHQPIADMSRAAVELLAAMLRAKRGGGEVRHVTLDYTLIRRQSDAAPRRRPPARTRG